VGELGTDVDRPLDQPRPAAAPPRPMPLRLFYRTSAIVRRLPEMAAELERLKKLVEGENKDR